MRVSAFSATGQNHCNPILEAHAPGRICTQAGDQRSAIERIDDDSVDVVPVQQFPPAGPLAENPQVVAPDVRRNQVSMRINKHLQSGRAGPQEIVAPLVGVEDQPRWRTLAQEFRRTHRSEG